MKYHSKECVGQKNKKKEKYFVWKFRFEYDRLNAYIHVNHHVRQIEELPTWRIPVLNIDNSKFVRGLNYKVRQ